MITPSFSLTATERVLPKLALDFTTASLDSRITFTRTTGASNPATYVNSSGVITAATNNQPRFDYDPISLVCKGLLIEESRANLITYSEDLTGTGWTKSAVITLTSSALVSPDGTQNAYEASITTNNGTVSKTVSVAANSATYYATCYYKYVSGGTATRLRLALTGGTSLAVYISFNAQTGAILVNGSGTGTVTNAGNGWYRVGVAITNNGTNTNLIVQNYITDDTTASKEIGIWGAQLEAGAFATSYIPTTSTALTRNADVATMTGTNFSDWFNASEGTLQAYYTNQAASTSPFSISDGTLNNRIQLTGRAIGASGTCAWISSGGVGQLTLSNVSFAETNTVSLAYKSNSCAASQNGSSPSTDGSASIPTVNAAALGNIAGSSVMCGHLKKINYWPLRLTNNEIQAISK